MTYLITSLMFTIEGFLTLSIVSLLIQLQNGNDSDFKVISILSSIVTFFFIFLTFVCVGVSYLLLVKQINNTKLEQLELQNCLKSLIPNDQDVRVNLVRILGVCDSSTQVRQDYAENISDEDKIIMHSYLKFLQYNNTVRDFFTNFIFLNNDLKF